MSHAVDALKLAVDFEKQALEKYKEAIPHVTNEQTRKAVEKYASEKNEQIDSLHWMIMAEAGQWEPRKLRPLKREHRKRGNVPSRVSLQKWVSI